jgi:NRPS condensation-like uncharacterized protein
LCGNLNVESLQRSLDCVAWRHEALRTRVVLEGGTPVQVIDRASKQRIDVTDLTQLSPVEQSRRIEQQFEQLVLEPIDIAVGPLWGVRVLKLAAREHVLIIAMEHMISDVASMRILLGELLTAYAQTLQDRCVSLPRVDMQFPAYSRWQRELAASWMRKHGAYWHERLEGCGRIRFPADPMAADVKSGWGFVPLRMDTELKSALSAWSRAHRTTLVMSVFTAYALLVLRWCGCTEMVIPYQIDGRHARELENTMGYLAATLFLRIQVRPDDTLMDVLERTKAEYANAYEHADFSILEADARTAELARNTQFNWAPQSSEFSLLSGSADELTCLPIVLANPLLKVQERDAEPNVQFFEFEREVAGRVNFPLNRFTPGTMEVFVHDFMRFIRALLEQPRQRVSELALSTSRSIRP